MSYALRPNYSQRADQLHCSFCRRNKEPEDVYRSHQLKDKENRITCPQLFKYRCELCGATGESAHTRSYCPTIQQFRQRSPERQQRGVASPGGGMNPSSANQAPTSGGTPSSGQEQNFSIQLGRDRMFRNMRGVTNTRYNSAGKLRKPIVPQRQELSRVGSSGGGPAGARQQHDNPHSNTHGGYRGYRS